MVFTGLLLHRLRHTRQCSSQSITCPHEEKFYFWMVSFLGKLTLPLLSLAIPWAMIEGLQTERELPTRKHQ